MAAKKSNVRDRILKNLGTKMKLKNIKAVEKIPVGSLILDRGLDGGIPRGKIVEIAGLPSAGKSTMTLIIASQFIRRGLEAGQDVHVAYIDVEDAYDESWARRIGLPVDAEDSQGNPCFDVFVEDSAEAALQAMVDVIKEDYYDLVIVDSIAELEPNAEANTSFDKSPQMALHASLFTRFCRAVKKPLRDCKIDTTLLLVNQYRVTISSNPMVARYNPHHTFGGMAIEFATDLRIEMKPAKGKWAKNGFTRETIDLRMKIKKTKVGNMPDKIWETSLLRQEDGSFAFDDVFEVVPMAKEIGLIVNKNGEVWSKGNAFYKDVKLGNGFDKILEFFALEENFDLFFELQQDVEAFITNGGVLETDAAPDDEVQDTEGDLYDA